MRQSGLHEREQTRKEQSGTRAQENERQPDVRKGLISGLIGGLIATYAMTQYQVNAPRLINRMRRAAQPKGGGESTTVVAADKITQAIANSPVPAEWRNLAGNLMHYGFGTVMGGLYGGLNEVLPATSTRRGLVYGAALWASADEIALPAAGLAKWWPAYPLHVHANALGAHLVYAVTLDGVRRAVHLLLDKRTRETEVESAYFRQPRRGVSAKYGRAPTRRFSRFGVEEERRAA